MKKNNYLDIVFCRNEEMQFEEKDQLITVFVKNKGFFNFMAQKFLNKPKVSQIHLEEFGSFIWKQIDGKRTVLEISELVKQAFGEKAEPLLPRLVQYFRILQNNNFVKKSTLQR